MNLNRRLSNCKAQVKPKQRGFRVANEPLQRRSLFGRWFRSRKAAAPTDHADRPVLLTTSNQTAIAVIASITLILMAASWIGAGGLGGGLVDIDSAEPLPAQFQTDINSADWTELMQLPEIGESLAKRIVESREREGRFASHTDLDRVRGIGPKTLDRIRPYLRPIE